MFWNWKEPFLLDYVLDDWLWSIYLRINKITCQILSTLVTKLRVQYECSIILNVRLQSDLLSTDYFCWATTSELAWIGFFPCSETE